MKRYWLTIGLVLFTLTSIWKFYTELYPNHLPEFKLSTIEGDPQEATPIELWGNYILNGNGRSERVSVNVAGSDYIEWHSLYQEIFTKASYSYQSSSVLKQLVHNHRSFMRGKKSLHNLYQDKDWVIYADMTSYEANTAKFQASLSVELLQRATGKEEQYEIPIEVQAEYHIAQVMRQDAQVHILAHSYPSHRTNGKLKIDYNTTQWIDFVVDIATGKLIRAEKLLEKTNLVTKFKIYSTTAEITSTSTEQI